MTDPQQPEVVIVDQAGTEHVFPAGFDPKKAADIVRAQANTPPAPTGAHVEQPGRSVLGTLGEVAKGVGKGAARSGIDLASMAAQSGMVPGLSRVSLPSEVTDKAREKMAYANTPQRIGGVLETAGEFAAPMIKAVGAIPTAGKAAAKFQAVMQAAKDVPIDLAEPGQAALRIGELADRGGSMPKAVRDFLRRATDPDKAAMTYGEGRDFASNISRLSADESNRLTPVVKRELGKMRVALNQANESAASTVGQGENYTDAMRQYAQAMKVKDFGSSVVQGAARHVPIATGAGAGAYLMAKLISALRGE